MGKYKTYQGTYIVKNREKYIGTQNPTYRSSWEYTFFEWVDSITNTNVIRWGSECMKIPYTWPDGSTHLYIPDFYVEMINKEGILKNFIVEIKPHGQGPFANKAGVVKTPQRPKNDNPKALKRYINEMVTYKKNESKWISAQAYCRYNNMEFIILSDEDFIL
jgi:hypothetical protein